MLFYVNLFFVFTCAFVISETYAHPELAFAFYLNVIGLIANLIAVIGEIVEPSSTNLDS